MQILNIFLVMTFLLVANIHAQKVKKVLFIGVDGVRGDALQEAPTPNIDLLNKRATYSYHALNTCITVSGPGWSNIFTGVLDDKHKVVDNGFKNTNLDKHPDILSIIKEKKPEFQTAAFYTWVPIGIILNRADMRIEREYAMGGDAYIHRLAQDYLTNETADATVVYYADPDIAGHNHGFTIEAHEYYREIVQFDRYVGDLMDAINARPNRANEEWLIVSTSDHGGFKTWHGGEHLSERNVFVIVAGDNIVSREIKRSNTMPIKPEDTLPVVELEKYGFQNVPTTFDIAPTILQFLDIEISGYNFDGKSLLKLYAEP
ncbi:Type I phosphodiesterase / nucleotide pyrophosphatase [Saccharicrinis carchari]|uniref:Type I phosphodiesterase / nucleotide pyrophosphatase n=1 Tax=Saccharicrinis carchari TaxID=1168039 RepID=A0A521BY41_SACCC|nr:alkaline phosphatase family protein [Saccharicrinis carchari]SMO52108.1 Type I phosphodiesterase / nucleotide pyrophosphatase [Saccharicrinis carchari]